MARLIDLHSHILPGIDDGARDLAMSVEMARIAIADGIQLMACTPHITPGVYDNDTGRIENAIIELRQVLEDEQLELELVMGADIHVSPEMGEQIIQGFWPRLGGTRYFLFEPPHRIMPPHLARFANGLLNQGLVPILTHPERLTWIEPNYDVICELGKLGVLVQLTAGSITGAFGKRAQYWSDRMLDENRVDIIASDAHNISGRPPILSRARDEIARRFGDEFALRLVDSNPRNVLNDQMLPQFGHMGSERPTGAKPQSFWRRISALAGWRANA